MLSSADDDQGRDGRGVRVLVLDDEEAVARTVAHLLLRDRFEVEVALSAAEALERAERFSCGVVFSDTRMPGGSGLALARRREAGRQFDPDLARAAARAFVGAVDLAS